MLKDVLVFSVYSFTPSTQIYMRARVPVIVEVACTVTGELTLEPLRGEQTLMPGAEGAEQVPETVKVNDLD